jgi:predicted RNA-binding Zn-ribbon protein involved in translation (DUF1610 family)
VRAGRCNHCPFNTLDFDLLEEPAEALEHNLVVGEIRVKVPESTAPDVITSGASRFECPRVGQAMIMRRHASRAKLTRVRRAAASGRRTGKQTASLAGAMMHSRSKKVRRLAASALSQRAR